MTSTASPNSPEADAAPAFDFEALRAKYREERDKRVRSDGNAQYQEIKDDFARYVDDPYVESGFTPRRSDG